MIHLLTHLSMEQSDMINHAVCYATVDMHACMNRDYRQKITIRSMCTCIL